MTGVQTCALPIFVWHDVLGFSGPIRKPKFVREYAALEADATDALGRFCADVRSGAYPSSAETYHMTDDIAQELGLDATPQPELAP